MIYSPRIYIKIQKGKKILNFSLHRISMLIPPMVDESLMIIVTVITAWTQGELFVQFSLWPGRVSWRKEIADAVGKNVVAVGVKRFIRT